MLILETDFELNLMTDSTTDFTIIDFISIEINLEIFENKLIIDILSNSNSLSKSIFIMIEKLISI